MKRSRTKTYSAAWAGYLIFIFALYPQLQITVLLFSIPLAMLGGWLFGYKGALFTIVLTIPVHFLLLNTFSDDPKVLQEALNPFGIISQLIFSCSTALLKASEIKYNKLNRSLEAIVAERTQDLEKLTHYLINAQQLESRELNASLLEKPYSELKNMLASCQLLKKKLEAEKHPRTNDAENIAQIISTCIQQLKALDDDSITNIPIGNDILESLNNLEKQVEELYDISLECSDDLLWQKIDAEKAPLVSQIIFEAVANALRHAEAESILIGIEGGERETTVFIENDGQPLPSEFKEGMGVPLMRYRAGKIGATLSIERKHTNLTRVTCTIPPTS